MLIIKKFPTLLFFLLCVFLLSDNVRAVLRDGQVDANFIVNPSSFGGTGRIDVILQMPDGKIVVGGSFTSVSAGAANNLARLNADGS